MRAKVGRGPTFDSKKGSFKLISRLGQVDWGKLTNWPQIVLTLHNGECQ